MTLFMGKKLTANCVWKNDLFKEALLLLSNQNYASGTLKENSDLPGQSKDTFGTSEGRNLQLKRGKRINSNTTRKTEKANSELQYERHLK